MLALLGSMTAVADDEVTLIGTVVESDWDDDGNVIEIELETDDGSYTIEISGKGQELLAHIDEQVEVVGTQYEDDDGFQYLKVSSYTLITE
jgi:hypothetical protein